MIEASEPRNATVSPGDSDDAVELLYRRCYAGLVRLAVALVDMPETAEEVVQEAFARVLTGRHRHATLLDLEGYVRAAVLNGARDVLRRRRVSRAWRPERARAGPSAEEVALLGEQVASVLGAVNRLPVRQRQVVALRYLGGLSEHETAEALGVSAGTVKVHTSRALARIRKEVPPDER